MSTKQEQQQAPTEQQQTEQTSEPLTMAAINAAINAALTAREARLLKTLDERLASVSRPQAQPTEGGDGKAADPKMAALEAKLRDLDARYKDAEERAKATEEKARRDRARADLRSALEAEGVKGAKAAALVSHFEASGALKFDDDGTPQLAVSRARSKGAAPEALMFPISDGVKDWSKTAEAAEFLPPPTPRTQQGQFRGGPRQAPQYEKPATSVEEANRRTVESLTAKGINPLDLLNG